MTLQEIYQKTKTELSAAGIEAPQEEAAWLLEHFFGCSRGMLPLQGQREADVTQTEKLKGAVMQRKSRRPLQYILGQWPFLDTQLLVGEGVLIPREDTAVLVKAALDCLPPEKELFGIDLCAGTGAVAIALCQSRPKLQMAAVEYHPPAYEYLLRNLSRYPECHIRPALGDITDPALPRSILSELIDETIDGIGGDMQLDFLVSNPPYIASKELSALQQEVQREPQTALDGGSDGLDFYRAIAKLWIPHIKPGGFVAVEIGETQGTQVSACLAEAGIIEMQVHRDLGGLDRAVLGIKQ